MRPARVVLLLLAYAGAAVAQQPDDTLLGRRARLQVRNVSLATALSQLAAQSGVAIVFSPEGLPARTVSCACDRLTVGQALDHLLSGAPLSYRAAAGRVLVRATPAGAEPEPDSGSIPSLEPPARPPVLLAPIAVAARLHVPDRMRFDSTAQHEAIDLSPAELSRVPAVIEADVARVVQLLPGIVARNDFSIGYNVRGGETDQNLVRLDGMTVFNPTHLGGMFGTFDVNALGGVTFYTGGFPAEFSGRLSSALDLEVRPGHTDSVRGRGQVSLLSSKLVLDGPLGPATFLLGARRTYADLVVPALVGEQLPYHFSDAVARLDAPLRSGSIALTGFWSRDALDLRVADPGVDGAEPAVDFRYGWRNALLGLTWRTPLGSGELTTRAGVSLFRTGLSVTPSLAGFDDDVRLLTVATRLAVRPSDHQAIAFGFGVEGYRVRYALREPTFEFSAVQRTFFGYVPAFNRVYRPTVFAVHAEDDWRVGRLQLRPGARAEYVRGPAALLFSPRLSVRYRIGRDDAVVGSAGRYYQAVQSLRDKELPVTLPEFWIGADARVPVARSDHWSVGYERWLRHGLQLVLEAYGRTFDGLVAPNRGFALRDPGEEFERVAGHAEGVEVLLRGHGGPVHGWLGYTLSRSVQRSGGASIPSAHDRRHTLHAVLEAQGPLGATLGARWTYGSPLPFTMLAGTWSHRRFAAGPNGFEPGDEEPFTGPVNDARLPSYSRLDLALRWRFQGLGMTWEPYLQAANAYNRANVFMYIHDFDRSPPIRRGIRQLPLLPSFGVELSW